MEPDCERTGLAQLETGGPNDVRLEALLDGPRNQLLQKVACEVRERCEETHLPHVSVVGARERIGRFGMVDAQVA